MSDTETIWTCDVTPECGRKFRITDETQGETVRRLHRASEHILTDAQGVAYSTTRSAR